MRRPRRSGPVPAASLGLGLGQPGQRVRRGRGLAAQQRELGEGPVDVRRQRVDTEARRLAALGAIRLRVLYDEGIDHYAVAMRDPEGTEFDIN